jgi:L-ascorbate metabolism protein UlaG (beta-lactamase superfamily)
MSYLQQFGGKVRPEDLEKFEQSPQWDGKKFNNQSETVMDVNLKTLPSLLKEQFTDREVRSPKEALPIMPLDAAAFAARPEVPKFIWYGHSALLLQLNGKNLLIDPMLGDDAAPIAPFDSKRFSANSLDIIDSLPPIDAILMTHDHYDHLDLDSFKKLKGKVNTYFVALGISRHLEKWGIPAEQITEFDWWDEINFEGIQITFTPSRHFSGRGPFDRAKSLWGGWVFKAAAHNIYWSGDGGYDAHFKEIGEKLGPFDWGFMECGQYNERWHAIHMFPEESIQAAQDAGVKRGIAVHWAGFALALHRWQDPIERFVAEAKNKTLPIVTPEIGQIVEFGKEPETNYWWEKLI